MTIIDNSSPYLNELEYSSQSEAVKAEIDALIIAGQSLLEEYCNRKFEEATYTDELHNGTQLDHIWVENPPITTLTNVKITHQGSTSSSDVDDTYEDNYFLTVINQGKIIFRGGRTFPPGLRNIKVNYIGGYSTADMPEPVKLAVAWFVKDLFDPSLNAEGMQKEKLGEYFYDKGSNYYEQLPVTRKMVLGLYKLRKIL